MPQFTITTSFNVPSVGAPLSVVFSSTFARAHYLNWGMQNFGIGNTSDAGVPGLSASFQGYIWDADVAATYEEYTTLNEIMGAIAARYENNQGGHLILKDELNLYPESQHTRYSRAVVAGSTETVNGISNAHLTFPCVPSQYDPATVKINKGYYSLVFQLAEIR